MKLRINWAASLVTWRVYDDTTGEVLRDDLRSVEITVPSTCQNFADGGCVSCEGTLVVTQDIDGPTGWVR